MKCQKCFKNMGVRWIESKFVCNSCYNKLKNKENGRKDSPWWDEVLKSQKRASKKQKLKENKKYPYRNKRQIYKNKSSMDNNPKT